MLFFVRLTLLLHLLKIGIYPNGILNVSTGRFIYKLYKLGAGSRRHISVDIGEYRIPVGRHGEIYVQSLYRIPCKQRISRSIYRSKEWHIRRFLRIHQEHIISLYLKTVIYILEMLETQIPIQGSRMPFHIGNMHIIEFQSGRSQMNRISNGKVGIQNIKLHGSIRHNSPIQIQSLELSVKMYFSRSPSFYILCY